MAPSVACKSKVPVDVGCSHLHRLESRVRADDAAPISRSSLLRVPEHEGSQRHGLVIEVVLGPGVTLRLLLSRRQKALRSGQRFRSLFFRTSHKTHPGHLLETGSVSGKLSHYHLPCPQPLIG